MGEDVGRRRHLSDVPARRARRLKGDYRPEPTGKHRESSLHGPGADARLSPRGLGGPWSGDDTGDLRPAPQPRPISPAARDVGFRPAFPGDAAAVDRPGPSRGNHVAADRAYPGRASGRPSPPTRRRPSLLAEADVLRRIRTAPVFDRLRSGGEATSSEEEGRFAPGSVRVSSILLAAATLLALGLLARWASDSQDGGPGHAARSAPPRYGFVGTTFTSTRTSTPLTGAGDSTGTDRQPPPGHLDQLLAVARPVQAG
jgi:hypothetical protein